MTEIQGEMMEIRGPLGAEQEQRVAALRAARETLASRAGMFGGSNVQNWNVYDLLNVADWVLSGRTDSSENDDEEGEELRESDLEWGRKQGRKEALIQAISVATAAGATDVAVAIRKLEPNADESPTDDRQLSFGDDEEPTNV